MLALPILVALLVLTLVPMGYAVGARTAVCRFGRRALPALLVIFSFALSAIGAWRVISVTPSTAAYRPFETHPIWMIALYAGFLVVALLPTTIRMARLPGARTQPFHLRQAVREIPWFLLGLLIALVIVLALDIAGVGFLPAMPHAPLSGAVHGRKGDPIMTPGNGVTAPRIS